MAGVGKGCSIKEITGNPEVDVSNGLYSLKIVSAVLGSNANRKTVPARSNLTLFQYAGAKTTLVGTPGFDNTERSGSERDR